MNQCNQRTDGMITHEVPLFASSWVALFVYLRESFIKDGTDDSATGSAGATRVTRTH